MTTEVTLALAAKISKIFAEHGISVTVVMSQDPATGEVFTVIRHNYERDEDYE